MTHQGCSTYKSTGFPIFQRSIFFDINVERCETFRQSLVASYQAIVATYYSLVTSHQQLVTSHWQPQILVTSNQLLVLVASYQSLVTSHQLLGNTSHYFLVNNVSSRNDICQRYAGEMFWDVLCLLMLIFVRKLNKVCLFYLSYPYV